MKPRVGVIILAAGESSRLGKPKQLLPFRGKTLLRHVAEVALASGCAPVAVVLGANFETIKLEVPTEAIVVKNTLWPEGMATSIQAGLAAIESQVDAVILMLADQPLVTSQILKNFAAHANRGIVAATYEGTMGVPVLFAKTYFPDLLALNGKSGAKQLLTEYASQVHTIPYPEAALDIDTVEDAERLRALE